MEFHDSHSQAGSRILNAYEMNAKSANLTKCALAAYSMLGDRSVKLVLTASSPITVEEAKHFVFTKFDNKLIPVTASFIANTDLQKNTFTGTIIASKASLIVEELNATTIKNKTCVNASSTLFLDQNLGCTWEKKSMNGKDCFVRNNEENIEQVVQACMTASSILNNNADDYIIKANKGDTVIFAGFEGDEGTPFTETGVVTEINAETKTVTVDIERDNLRLSTEIPAHAILSVVPVTAAVSKQEVVDFLTRAYGPRFKEVLEKTGAFESEGTAPGLIKEYN